MSRLLSNSLQYCFWGISHAQKAVLAGLASDIYRMETVDTIVGSLAALPLSTIIIACFSSILL